MFKEWEAFIIYYKINEKNNLGSVASAQNQTDVDILFKWQHAFKLWSLQSAKIFVLGRAIHSEISNSCDFRGPFLTQSIFGESFQFYVLGHMIEFSIVENGWF